MKAYFVSPVADIFQIDWSNMICMSHDMNVCVESRNQFLPNGKVLEIDMDDNDVVCAVGCCMHGDSCTVRCKTVAVVA